MQCCIWVTLGTCMQKCYTHREFKQNVDFNIDFCSGLKLCDTIAIKAGYINPKIQPNMKLMVTQNRLYQKLCMSVLTYIALALWRRMMVAKTKANKRQMMYR